MSLELANTIEDITFNIVNGDLVNPVIIKTPYSNSVLLPFSTENDKIFGYFNRTDKLITTNDFNPNERFPYQIRYNQEIVRKGYLQLNEITKEGYNVTLYDDLGAILRDMSETKLVDIFTKVPFKINKSSINNMMRLMPGEPLTDPLHTMRYLWWYSFMPTYQGLYDNFNSGKLEKDNGTYIEIPQQDEHETRELRSYYQKPGIWYNKIISDIAKHYSIELDNDFHNEANPYWSKALVMFNSLYSDKFTNDAIADIDGDILYEKTVAVVDNNTLNTRVITPLVLTPIQNEYGVYSSNKIDLSNYPKGQVEIEYEFDLKLFGKCTPRYTAQYFNHFQLGPNTNNYVYDDQIHLFKTHINTYIQGQSNKNNEVIFGLKQFDRPTLQSIYPVICFDTPNNSNPANFPNVPFFSNGVYAQFVLAGNKNYADSPKADTYKIKGKSILINDGSPKELKVEVSYSYNSSNVDLPATYGLGSNTYGQYSQKATSLELSYKVNGNIKINNVEQIRSHHMIDKDNIIPQAMDCGGIFINHLKQYGLVLYENEFGDFKVSMRDTYFTKYNKVLDWNSKICNDLDISMKPLNYDSKYYKLNHIPYSIKHMEDYTKRFGKDVEFGAMQINTSYEFGDLTPKSLQEGYFTQPVVSQEYGVYERGNLGYFYRYDQVLPSFATIDDSGKRTAVDFDYTIMFRENHIITPEYQTNYPIDLISKPSFFIISDDTPSQTYNNEFCWTYNYLPANGATLQGVGNPQHPYKIKLSYTGVYLAGYPYIRSITKDGNYSLDWGKPKQYYYDISDAEYNENGTLYNRFYSNWFKDRYDVNTKVLTAYFLLNQNDLNNIRFNKFIFLYNSYWIIDRISEFKYGEVGPIQVTLIKVNDINNYTNGQRIT